MPFTPLKSEKYRIQNTGDRIYADLREAIMLLQLHPGEELNIKSLSEKLGVSRSPVRDAVMRLAKEGLADVLPQKGTRVSRIDPHRVEEERFLRESLEIRLLSLFMQQHTSQDVSDLEQLVETQNRCLRETRMSDFLDYDEAFHSVFFRAADKALCWDLIEQMSGHYRRARLMTLWDAKIVSGAIGEHEEMLRCIRQGQTDRLTEIEENHCRKINIQELDLFQQYPDFFTERKE
ncbi:MULTISPECIES: GntR family transcriptional regulator [Caproicibacterium]|uniref:GntR family transcriptional regulator n=1 Tax=Caproicibacterium argilliputei TaxID=3030016 RepID=A0AA97D6R5_9FIRM|nr:GntR family transcriptional regulator [Caproicibacterium argilliputei]WOC31610.1 GntR family transcriptional regulator [Caproicibacterium argilliputei]